VSLRRFGQEFLAFESPQWLDACPRQSAKEVGRHTFGMASETETRPLLQGSAAISSIMKVSTSSSSRRLRLYRPVSEKTRGEKDNCSSAGSRERNPGNLGTGANLGTATPKALRPLCSGFATAGASCCSPD
jgi:hypothetical protein